MEKGKKSKIVVIISLCVSILGLTLGFAAFSNTLTISSSAIVSPDAADFKIKTYGVTNLDGFVYTNVDYYDSNSISVPLAEVGVTNVTNAKISEDGLHISNISATLEDKLDFIVYFFLVKNEGKYDAYFNYEELLNRISNPNSGIQCIAREETRQDLVDEACKNMMYMIGISDANGNDVIRSDTSSKHYLLKPGEHLLLTVNMEYSYRYQTAADGDFDVVIPDINLEFTTVPPVE